VGEVYDIGGHIVHEVDVVRDEYDGGVGLDAFGNETTELEYAADVDVTRWFIEQ